QQIGGLVRDAGERTEEDLRLLVNELVTNSLRHAKFVPGDRIEVLAKVEGQAIRVEVRDPGPGFRPAQQTYSPSRADRWGLYLVDRLAESWGVDNENG